MINMELLPVDLEQFWNDDLLAHEETLINSLREQNAYLPQKETSAKMTRKI